EEVVRSALLPDPVEAIDTLLLNLRPCDQKKDFSCIVQLDELNDDEVYVVRKTLAAGAALGMILVDDDDEDRHHVHRDFYRLLGHSVPTLKSPTMSLCNWRTESVTTEICSS